MARWIPQARRGRGLEAKEFGAPEAKGRLLTLSPILLHCGFCSKTQGQVDRGKSLVHYFQKNGEEEFVKIGNLHLLQPLPQLAMWSRVGFLSQTLNTSGESQQVSRPSTLRAFHLGDLQAPHK